MSNFLLIFGAVLMFSVAFAGTIVISWVVLTCLFPKLRWFVVIPLAWVLGVLLGFFVLWVA